MSRSPAAPDPGASLWSRACRGLGVGDLEMHVGLLITFSWGGGCRNIRRSGQTRRTHERNEKMRFRSVRLEVSGEACSSFLLVKGVPFHA